MEPPLLLHAKQVQHELGLSRSKVYEMMAAGELPVVRIGRSVRVPADKLRQWIEHQAAEGGQGKESLP